MSSPYPPQAPKRLERSKSNRIIGGVCAGVANYLNMDPTLVRVLTVVVSLFTGVPIVLYIIALFVVPEEGSQPIPPSYPPVGAPQGQAGDFSAAPPQSAQSAYAPPPTSAPGQPSQTSGSVSSEDSIWGKEGAPWEQRQAEPMTPQPQSERESEPTAPSEPEAPVAPAAHEEDATEWAAEPEGPEHRPADMGGAPPEGTPKTESGGESEGGQPTDRS
jgi:phage shock protein C